MLITAMCEPHGVLGCEECGVPLRVCRRCLGEHAIMRLHYDGPFVVMPLDPDNRFYQSDLRSGSGV